jgi:REP element-mobilizing transposase RayT
MYYHITFGTYERRPVLVPDRREEFLKFCWGVVTRLEGKLYRINAVEDHLHMLVAIPVTMAVSEFIKTFKLATNAWAKESGAFPGFEHWQEGYGIFTTSHAEKDGLIEYIKNQQEHHRKESFRDEFRRLLREAGVEFEERFLP